MSGNKYLSNVAGVITEVVATQTTAGAGDAGKIPALDAAGRLALTMMPVGLGPDTASIVTSENLAAGDLVNIYNVTGTGTARKADATTAGKQAHGYVLSSTTSGQTALVYFEGPNTSVTGLTPGNLFLATTAGLTTATAPSASGSIVQRVGIATGATSMNFQMGEPITVA